MKDNPKLRDLMGVLVAFVWLTAFLDGVIEKDYEALTLVTPVMLIYAGYVFGSHFIQKRLPSEEE